MEEAHRETARKFAAILRATVAHVEPFDRGRIAGEVALEIFEALVDDADARAGGAMALAATLLHRANRGPNFFVPVLTKIWGASRAVAAAREANEAIAASAKTDA